MFHCMFPRPVLYQGTWKGKEGGWNIRTPDRVSVALFRHCFYGALGEKWEIKEVDRCVIIRRRTYGIDDDVKVHQRECCHGRTSFTSGSTLLRLLTYDGEYSYKLRQTQTLYCDVGIGQNFL